MVNCIFSSISLCHCTKGPEFCSQTQLSLAHVSGKVGESNHSETCPEHSWKTETNDFTEDSFDLAEVLYIDSSSLTKGEKKSPRKTCEGHSPGKET